MSGRAAAVLLLVCAAGCRHQPASVRIDPALATLVPADTVLMVGTRLEALQKTPVYKKYFEGRRFAPLDEFVERTGLDPRKDLWELLFCSNGRDGVLMGRGKFSSGDMEPRLERQGATRFAYKGYTLVGDERAAVLLWGPGLAMTGSTAALRRMVDHRQSSSGPPPSLAKLIEQIPVQSQFWAAYAGGGIRLPFDEGSNLANINRMLASVGSGRFTADLTAGLDIRATGSCTSDDGARQIHDALKAMVGLARLSTPADKQELLKAYDAIQITKTEREVKLELKVPEEIVDKFVSAWMGR